MLMHIHNSSIMKIMVSKKNARLIVSPLQDVDKLDLMQRKFVELMEYFEIETKVELGRKAQVSATAAKTWLNKTAMANIASIMDLCIELQISMDFFLIPNMSIEQAFLEQRHKEKLFYDNHKNSGETTETELQVINAIKGINNEKVLDAIRNIIEWMIVGKSNDKDS
jgi:hypothetical protein